MAHVEAHNWREGLSLLQRINYMMEGQYACDVTLKAGQGKHQESIKAHRFILIAGSPYFEALMERDPNAKQNALFLDTPPVIMKEIIKFFYREEVDLHSSNGLELLVASKKYEIPQLTQQCSQFLEANLTLENVSTILTQSLTNGEIKLADKCVKLISQNTKEVFGSVEFPSMSQAAVMRVVESDVLLGVTEMEVYHACLKWADQQCRFGGREVSGKNCREVLADTIYQIRFPTMSSVQFAELAGETSLLTPSEQASIFQQIALISAGKATSTSTQFIAKKRMQVSPQLSAGKQSGPPRPPSQLLSDKQSGPPRPPPQLSSDKQSGPPRPPPQLSSDKQSGPPRPPPQLSSDKQSGPPRPPPQLSSDKQSGPPRPPPQLSSDKQSGPPRPPPQLSTDKQSGPPPPTP